LPETRRPDFFIVGAPKCGTTAMDRYLKQHPEIFVPEAKELHYFGRDLVLNRHRDTLEEYLARFEGGADARRAGEASVWYLWSRTAAREIKDFEPEARIIIMLRDPVEVMYSQHSQAIINGLGDEDILDFAEALAAEPDRAAGRRVPKVCTFADGLRYREIVRFTGQVRRYFEVFGRERVHVILFDDFKADVAATYRELLTFLEVDPSFEADLEVINANQVVRSQKLRKAQRLIPTRLKGLVPTGPRKAISGAINRMNIDYQKRKPMDPDLRAQLKAELAGEVEALSELLGRDLTHWSKP
jgi:hypothetical protein